MTTTSNPFIRVVTGVPSGEVPPQAHSLRAIRDVLSPMRDGVKLSMDLLRPEAPGRYPVILQRTPYNKAGKAPPLAEKLARRGYIVANQDCRGRFNSDGVFDPYRQEHEDGFDTVEWIAAQDWCDGNVGMIGGSYNGQTQWYAAANAPKALKAIVPIVSPPGHPFMNEPLYGGAVLMAMSEWMYVMGRRSELVPGLEKLFTQDQPYFEALPLSSLAEAAGVCSSWWDEWLSHPTYDDYWRARGYEDSWSKMTVPALNITGWWDMNFLGAPRNFVGMREHAATHDARDGQRLVIGPWPHWVNVSRTLNGMDLGPTAVTDLDSYTIRFFDHWLRGAKGNGIAEDSCVHIFVLGANEWWEANQWPLPGTKPTPFYLHSAGRANSHRGDGVLSENEPGAEPADQYVADPFDPVRSLWNLHEGPVDDRPISARPDVLCYTSEVITEPVDVVGPVRAVLYASSSARDCDWHVRLVDVYPDGPARFLCHGVLRARFREGFDKSVRLDLGKIERFEIDVTATGVRFLPGHRIRVEIASSWFTRFDRNTQTGAENWMTDEQLPVVAHQTIYHDSEHPSHVVLPLMTTTPSQ